MSFYVGGVSPAMTIKETTGNVGIGVSPANKLDVDGAIASWDENLLNEASSIKMSFETDSAGQIKAWGADASTGGILKLKTASSNASIDNVGITIIGDGKVGIGTQTPGSELDLAGGYIADEQGRTDHAANTTSGVYYHLDGTNDYISVASHAKLTFSDSFTIAMYIDPNDNANDQNPLIGRTTASNDRPSVLASNGWAINYNISGGYLNFGWGSGSANYVYWGLTKKDLMHLVFVVDTSTEKIQLYLNGAVFGDALDASSAGSNATHGIASMVDVDTDIKIGRNNHGDYYHGDIYKLGLYNTALSAEEVKKVYSGGATPFRYIGANQTEMVAEPGIGSANWTAEGASGWSFADQGGGDYEAVGAGVTAGSDRFYDDAATPFVQGKIYKVTYNVTAYTSGRVRALLGQTNMADSGDSVYSSYTTTNGTGIYTDIIHTVNAMSTNSSEIAMQGLDSFVGRVDDIHCVQIGSVAEYDGGGVAADYWIDKSDNNMNGTVSGATVQNAPGGASSGLIYDEGTFTPVFEKVSGGIDTINNNNETSGHYTRVGNLVNFWLNLHVDSYAEATSTTLIINIASLGYANTGERAECNFSFGDGANWINSGDGHLTAELIGTLIYISETASDGATRTDWNVGDFDTSGFRVWITGAYKTG